MWVEFAAYWLACWFFFLTSLLLWSLLSSPWKLKQSSSQRSRRGAGLKKKKSGGWRPCSKSTPEGRSCFFELIDIYIFYSNQTLFSKLLLCEEMSLNAAIATVLFQL